MPNPYYSSEQTSQSRDVLDTVTRLIPDAILIGGWGTWYRTHGPMSHDIDLIVSYQDLNTIRANSQDFSESTHLAGTKWRATTQDIHLDLYVPYRSRLGANLQLRVEDLTRHVDIVAGQRLLTIPAHLATKFAALLDRPHSMPGEKDRHEILELLNEPNAHDAPTVIAAATTRTLSQTRSLITQAFGFLSQHDGLPRRAREHLTSTAKQWLASLPAENTPQIATHPNPPHRQGP